MTENKNTMSQDLIVVMDESGSMADMGSEPLEALNSFVNEQQKALKGDDSTFTLWNFSSTVRLVIGDQRLQDVKYITDYYPHGMTALYDGIGNAITTKYKKENVVCLIITDGQENSSVEFSGARIKELIHQAETKKNWKFIFMGAKDIFAEGEKSGFQPKRCVAYTPECPGMLLQLSRNVSKTVARYRSSTSQGIKSDIDLRGIESSH